MAVQMITANQIKMMFVMAKKLGMDNDTLHAYIKAHYGPDSLKDLTRSQATLAIDVMKYRAGEAIGGVPDRATYPQRGLINGLEAEVFGNDPARIRGFLENRFGVSNVAFIPYGKVNGVINALKSMKTRGYRSVKDGKPKNAPERPAGAVQGQRV